MRCAPGNKGTYVSWDRKVSGKSVCVRPNEVSESIPKCPKITQPEIGTFLCSMNGEHSFGYDGEHCLLSCPASYKLAKNQNNQINCRCNSRGDCSWAFQEKTKCVLKK